MNIILIHYAAQPIVGGVENVIGHHANLLVDHGHFVRIIAGRGIQAHPRVPFVPLPLVDSNHPEVLQCKADLDKGYIPPSFAKLFNRLEFQLAQIISTADILIAHNVCSLAKNLPLTAAIKSLSQQPGMPRLVLWHHDLAWGNPRYQNELFPGYPWELLRSSWPGALHVTISEFRREELCNILDILPEKIKVIPAGMDECKFHKIEEQTAQIVSRLHLLDADPLFLLPVRLTPRKNIELALRAFACLRQNFYPEAQIVITGPPGPHNPTNIDYFQRLTHLRNDLDLRDTAHFIAEIYDSNLPDSIIADLYHLSDALILPSKEEGFGLPILEAGLIGLPIFCSNIPPLHELGGEDVVYFSPNAPPDQVATIIFNGLSANSAFSLRSRVRHQYNWENIYRQISTEILGETIQKALARNNQNPKDASINSQYLIGRSPQLPNRWPSFSSNVEKWVLENSFHSDEFSNLDKLLALKREHKLTISLVLPTLNVADTLEEIILTLQSALVEKVPLVDEFVVIDSGSKDDTRTIAANLGLRVFVHQNILPNYNARAGKGEALWKSLYITHGDILVWLDADIHDIHPRFVYGLLGPLLVNKQLKFIKGFYRRPLKVGSHVLEDNGGRVTELVARPLINLYFPELSGVLQPLAGECAGRRTVLEQLPFLSGYGVDIGLLLDIFTRYGLNAIAQVDLLRRVHNNQSITALGKMSFAVMRALITRAEWHLKQNLIQCANDTLVYCNPWDKTLPLDVLTINELERPPMIELPEYLETHSHGNATLLDQ